MYNRTLFKNQIWTVQDVKNANEHFEDFFKTLRTCLLGLIPS